MQNTPQELLGTGSSQYPQHGRRDAGVDGLGWQEQGNDHVQLLLDGVRRRTLNPKPSRPLAFCSRSFGPGVPISGALSLRAWAVGLFMTDMTLSSHANSTWRVRRSRTSSRSARALCRIRSHEETVPRVLFLGEMYMQIVRLTDFPPAAGRPHPCPHGRSIG